MKTKEASTESMPQSLEWVERLTVFLDESIVIPGTNMRVGADPIIGLLPVGGDFLSVLASLLMALAMSAYAGGIGLFVRMLVNIGIDFLVGSVLVVGDLFDFGFKANRRNINLFKSYLRDFRAKATKDLIKH